MKAVFLDRDGTIIEHVPYLTNPSKVKLAADSVKAIRIFNDLSLPVFVVTNQSAVARGLCTPDEVAKINRVISDKLEEKGALLNEFYVCPHHPGPLDKQSKYQVMCKCRKPLPGLLHMAAKDHSIDLHESFMIGDNDSDIGAGKSAGCITIRLPSSASKNESIEPDFVAGSLLEAAGIIRYIILKERKGYSGLQK